jgi:hypothetical protein
MSSFRQIEANPRNARLSTGPIRERDRTTLSLVLSAEGPRQMPTTSSLRNSWQWDAR